MITARRLRAMGASIAVVSVLLVVGCGSPPTARSGGTGTGSGTAAGSAAPSPTPTPGTVPVDQIPPGRPANWIPAGVTTTAPWEEPSDIVPRFTLAMFEHTPAGAADAAMYYANARNWAFATLDPRSFLLICDSLLCKQSADRLRAVAAVHGHIIGARQTFTSWTRLSPPRTSPATWVIRMRLTVHAGRSVDGTGATIQAQQTSTEINDLYMRWTGTMWHVLEDALGR